MSLGYEQPDELPITIANLLNDEIANKKSVIYSTNEADRNSCILLARELANVDLSGMENI